MKFPTPVSIQWIASLIGAHIEGNDQGFAEGINEIHKVEKGDLVFVDHPKYYQTCISSDASFIIINASTSFPADKTLLIVEEPFEAYLKIIRHFRPFEQSTLMIHPSASIGKSSYIAPGCYIGKDVQIGENCILHPQVCINDHVVLGNNIIIQSGTVIGSDAFYYNTKKNRETWYKKMESCGRVILHDDVEIGANCTIDRGVTNDTVIGKGTKIDNLVHIGHDVVVGKNCLFAAQVGIAGATIIEDGVVLWGQVGVGKTLTIGENAMVMGQGGVISSIEGNKIYWGTPAEDQMSKKREMIWVKRIPEIWNSLKELTDQSKKRNL
jgi:UDP-3-O-[3-hydroxymyristoyl] glucosamine N-acyltransferase